MDPKPKWKPCVRCKRLLPVRAFSPRGDAHFSYCRPCGNDLKNVSTAKALDRRRRRE